MRKLMWSACLVAVVAVAGVAGSVMTGPSRLTAADGTAPAAAAKGQLTADSLGTMLSAIGLKAERSESRYDFQFSS